jgi:hypothetical protein
MRLPRCLRLPVTRWGFYEFLIQMRQSNDNTSVPFFSRLERFYERVDANARLIYELDPERFQCNDGCHGCCIDGLTVFEIEAKYIVHTHGDLLVYEKPHPAGTCAFLNESGACRIYEHRPYVCRTQGLPLRWIEELPDSLAVEMRDICPHNDKGAPIETLAPDACWTVGPFEEELAMLEIAGSGKTCRRILLRRLFDGDTLRQISGLVYVPA